MYVQGCVGMRVGLGTCVHVFGCGCVFVVHCECNLVK